MKNKGEELGRKHWYQMQAWMWDRYFILINHDTVKKEFNVVRFAVRYLVAVHLRVFRRAVQANRVEMIKLFNEWEEKPVFPLNQDKRDQYFKRVQGAFALVR